MWLFGAINLIEISFTKTIRKHLGKDDKWQEFITENRISKTEWVYNDRLRRCPNLDIDMIDCLQFGDKAIIVIKNDNLREMYNFKSRNRAKDEIKHIEQLRNTLAHGQFIDPLDLREGIDTIVSRIEGLVGNQRLKSNDMAMTINLNDPEMLQYIQNLQIPKDR